MDNTIIAFGIGNNFFSFLARLPKKVRINYVSDNNKNYWGKNIAKDILCIPPHEISKHESPLVIIMLDSEKHILEVQEQLEKMGIDYIGVHEIIGSTELEMASVGIFEHENRIQRFIDLHLDSTTLCNFHCSYCSVWRRTGTGTGTNSINKTVDELSVALSKDRLGGQCYINICARGETLLSDRITDIVHALTKEGHVVSLVTNGTISKRIDEIASFPNDLQKRTFFKLSFHYAELIKHNMMEVFWDNVAKIRSSKCSYSIEITPCDEIVNSISDICRIFEEKADGAMPHITFTRDSTKKGLDLLSEYDLNTYENIWSSFGSKLFDLKTRWYNKKMDQYCMAGHWSCIVDADTGNIRPCFGYGPIGNIYDDGPFPSKPVGYECRQAYCFNNHVYVAWGCQPDIKDYSYADMRDRTDNTGKHWLNENVRYAFDQKLYDNRFCDVENWPDYLRLLNRDETKAVILFNSPDYSNLGDHAIALATKQFFEKEFTERPFYEVSCREYEKEKRQIEDRIKPDDIIIINGGGNIDSIHLRLLDMTEDIIENFPDNTIFIFPQTIYFSDDKFGKEEAERFKNTVIKHGNVHLSVREKRSYEIVKELFKGSDVDIQHIFDLAFTLDYSIKEKRDGILLCMRNDKEVIKGQREDICRTLHENSVKYEETSTLVDRKVLLNNRKEEVYSFMEKLAFSEVVITDRLHCMILAVITGTPCIVMDNLTGKVRAVYEQISDLPYIYFLNETKGLYEALESLKDISAGMAYEEFGTGIRKKMDGVSQWIKKEAYKN